MELFGGAGHSKEIAKRISSKGMLIGIDRDQEALKAAQNNLKEFHNIKYVHDNHDNIKNILEKLNIEKVDGILLDLGVSSYQLDERNRGFSYLGENELDMRMDKTQNLTAKEVINSYSEEKLANIIFEYGEERFSKNIARNICIERKKEEIQTILFVEKRLPELLWEIEKVSYLDGCKVYFKNGGWIICRFSGTEPLLRIFCEMPEEKDILRAIHIFESFFKL